MNPNPTSQRHCLAKFLDNYSTYLRDHSNTAMASPRIQELPDDLDSSLDLNKDTAPTTAPPVAVGPELPPPSSSSNQNVSLDQMFSRRTEGISDKSLEEIMYDMSKTPLFMSAEDVANQSTYSSAAA